MMFDFITKCKCNYEYQITNKDFLSYIVNFSNENQAVTTNNDFSTINVVYRAFPCFLLILYRVQRSDARTAINGMKNIQYHIYSSFTSQ